MPAGFPKAPRLLAWTLGEENEESTLGSQDLAAATGWWCSTASILSKPGRTLPGPFNDPLAFLFFCGLLSIVKDNSLYGWSIKRSSFLFTYFYPYQSGFCLDFRIAVATKDMLLFQVSTLRTNIYVPLKKTGKTRKYCDLSNSSKRNGEQSQTTAKVT